MILAEHQGSCPCPFIIILVAVNCVAALQAKIQVLHQGRLNIVVPWELPFKARCQDFPPVAITKDVFMLTKGKKTWETGDRRDI